jgi:DNA-binding NarL/FixJ family response regulator
MTTVTRPEPDRPVRRILVVEDQPLMASLLEKALSAQGFDVAVASDAASGRKQALTFDPDIALIDVLLGVGPSGVDLARILHVEVPGIALVLLTRVADLEAIGVTRDSLPPGTSVLQKDAIGEASMILSAIESALAGDPQDAASSPAPISPLAVLTSKQRAILRLAADGLTNAAIARERNLSMRAVEEAFQRIYLALGIAIDADINPRVSAVRWYLTMSGLVREP